MSLLSQILLMVWVAGVFFLMEAYLDEQRRLAFYCCDRQLDKVDIFIIFLWPVALAIIGAVLLAEKFNKE